jgi:hypothetical protein
MPLYTMDEADAHPINLCDHEKLCTKCGREKCIQNMQHSRLYGYACVCGNQEWKRPDLRVHTHGTEDKS